MTSDPMLRNATKVYVQTVDWGRRTGIAVVEHTYEGRKLVETMLRVGEPPVVLNELDAITEPTLSLTKEQAQELFDGLYAIGFRPKIEGKAVGELAGVRAHLEDMRALAFDKLEVTKP